MRLDHLLSKEEVENLKCVLLFSYQAKIFLVPMRLGETPVPIPNTTVKTQSADGTALETVWESRWAPDQKRKQQVGNLMKIKQALESESCRKQDGARYESSSPVLTRISREELLR